MLHVVWRLMCRLRTSWRCDTPQGPSCVCLSLAKLDIERPRQLVLSTEWLMQGEAGFSVEMVLRARECSQDGQSSSRGGVGRCQTCNCSKWYLRSTCKRHVCGGRMQTQASSFYYSRQSSRIRKMFGGGAAGRSGGIRFCGRFVHHSKP